MIKLNKDYWRRRKRVKTRRSIKTVNLGRRRRKVTLPLVVRAGVERETTRIITDLARRKRRSLNINCQLCPVVKMKCVTWLVTGVESDEWPVVRHMCDTVSGSPPPSPDTDHNQNLGSHVWLSGPVCSPLRLCLATVLSGEKIFWSCLSLSPVLDTWHLFSRLGFNCCN